MELREYISESGVYKKIEIEIKAWVEESYPGLSIEYEPHLEVVQTEAGLRFTKPRVARIVEAVNAKIGEIMEAHAEEIYIAERLERIYRRHPEFTLDVDSVEAIKRDKRFLRYLKELVNGE